MVEKRRWPRDRTVRDVAVFATGLVGALHDIFLTDWDKPYRFAFFGTLMGLAVYLRANGRG